MTPKTAKMASSGVIITRARLSMPDVCTRSVPSKKYRDGRQRKATVDHSF